MIFIDLDYFLLLLTNFLGPFRVLAFVFVLCPLTGKPLLCLKPLQQPISVSLLILRATSLLKSPSTLYDSSIIFLIAFSCSSVKSFTLVSGLTPAFSRIFCELDNPIPQIYVKPISTLFSLGKSTPAIRAIFFCTSKFFLIIFFFFLIEMHCFSTVVLKRFKDIYKHKFDM